MSKRPALFIQRRRLFQRTGIMAWVHGDQAGGGLEFVPLQDPTDADTRQVRRAKARALAAAASSAAKKAALKAGHPHRPIDFDVVRPV